MLHAFNSSFLPQKTSGFLCVSEAWGVEGWGWLWTAGLLSVPASLLLLFSLSLSLLIPCCHFSAEQSRSLHRSLLDINSSSMQVHKDILEVWVFSFEQTRYKVKFGYRQVGSYRLIAAITEQSMIRLSLHCYFIFHSSITDGIMHYSAALLLLLLDSIMIVPLLSTSDVDHLCAPAAVPPLLSSCVLLSPFQGKLTAENMSFCFYFDKMEIERSVRNNYSALLCLSTNENMFNITLKKAFVVTVVVANTH